MTTPRTRKAPEVRRQEILEAMRAIGAERGLDAITVRDVAERAGVAPGLIHHYFPSMDAMVVESFGTWADGVLARISALEGSVSPRMALALVVANLTPEQRLWFDALSTASRSELLRGRASELSVGYHASVASIIVAGVADGSFSCADPDLVAWRIIVMLDGLVPMVHILHLIPPQDIAAIVGPVIEGELELAAGSFTDLVQAIMSGREHLTL